MRSAKYLQSRQARENRMGNGWKYGWRFLQANQPHSAKQSKNEHETPLCNRPSGIYILKGFSVRLLFCLFQTYTDDMCWICKICTGEATNWPGKRFHKVPGEAKFSLVEEKNQLKSSFTGSLTEGCHKANSRSASVDPYAYGLIARVLVTSSTATRRPALFYIFYEFNHRLSYRSKEGLNKQTNVAQQIHKTQVLELFALEKRSYGRNLISGKVVMKVSLHLYRKQHDFQGYKFGINTASDISKFTKISRAAAAASNVWVVLKYHEPVFIQNTPKKPCCFLFLVEGREISHFT